MVGGGYPCQIYHLVYTFLGRILYQFLPFHTFQNIIQPETLPDDVGTPLIVFYHYDTLVAYSSYSYVHIASTDQTTRSQSVGSNCFDKKCSKTRCMSDNTLLAKRLKEKFKKLKQAQYGQEGAEHPRQTPAKYEKPTD